KPQLPSAERPGLVGQIGLPKQLPPPRLGENLRSRTYFPERTRYQPERPLEVKGGAREGELLDQYGLPVKAAEPTMTERERLRSLYKGRLGEGARTELERLETRMRDVVNEAGGDYVGIQQIQGRPLYLVFNPKGGGSTMYLDISEATPQAVRRKIADK